jgi:hypothetical protein
MDKGDEKKEEELKKEKEKNAEKIKEILDKFEEKYYISGFIDEEEFRKKLVELNYDVKKMDEWVNSKM